MAKGVSRIAAEPQRWHTARPGQQAAQQRRRSTRPAPRGRGRSAAGRRSGVPRARRSVPRRLPLEDVHVAPRPTRLRASRRCCGRARCAAGRSGGGPASPRSCQTSSAIWASPVAPTGWPREHRPPLGLTAMPPPGSVAPDFEQLAGPAGLAEAELLVVEELARRHRVVHLGDVDVVRADARPPRRRAGRSGRRRSARPASRSVKPPHRLRGAHDDARAIAVR